MAISFVGAGTPGGHSGFPGPTLPAGVQTGDILLLSALGGESQVIANNGYAGLVASGGTFNYWLRHAGAAAPTVFNDSVRIVAYRGCADSGNPFGPNVGANGATLTTTVANSWALFSAQLYDGVGQCQLLAPSSGPALTVDSTANDQTQGNLTYAFQVAHGLVQNPSTTAGQSWVVSGGTAIAGGHFDLFELLAGPQVYPNHGVAYFYL